MKKILIGILLLLIVGINGIFASEEKTTVRVGISSSDFSTFEHSEAEFTSNGIYNVTDIPSGQKIEFSSNDVSNFKYSNGAFVVSNNGEIKAQDLKGPLVLTSADKIGIKGIKRKGESAFYHGMIELKPTRKDKFNIINILSLQNYLKGVVPNEMPIAFGLEALKAQAVAARNYVNRPNGTYSNYDVCDSVACQVYYGANSQTPISDKAVDETLGIYAMYDNEIILALYSSTASGITENYFNTFGDEIEDKPYLKSVRDTDKLSRLNEEEYFKTNPPSFDMESPKYRWVVEFERGELEDILSKTLFEQTKTKNVFPAFEKGKKIEGIEDIKILKKGVSKKALVVEIKSNSGNYTVVKELPIRRVLKKDNKILPSANFIVEKIEDKKNKKETEKAAESEEKTPIFQSEENSFHFFKQNKNLPKGFKFYGAGFGHGVGMSQFGAGYLSKYGIPYENILKHYYTGINLGTMPKTVYYNDIELYYAVEFYFDKNQKKSSRVNLSKNPLRTELEDIIAKGASKKCYLVIENFDKVSNLKFSINDYDFNQNANAFKKKILETDITDYLKTGVNRIVFWPLSSKDKKKKIRFYVVFGELNGKYNR